MRTIAMMTLAAVATSVAMAVTPVMSLPMEMDSEKEVTESVSGNTYAVRGKHGDNVPAVIGKGLRTDGYSTYVSIPMSDYELNSEAFSISFWTACQTYPMMVMDIASNQEGAIISCLDDTAKKGFAFYLYSQGNYGFSCYINGEKKTLTASYLFPQYEWVHLAATIDLAGNAIKLYRNGDQVASTYINKPVALPTGNMYIGKSYTDNKAGQFMLNTYNGIIDELNIYNEVLTSDDIRQLATSQLPTTLDLNMPASHFRSDITRPRHHAMPASNWMNESHGMAYSDGRYHLFFQKNGNGPYMSRLHWGHLSSADLCNWTEERIAIVPGKPYDIKGCWSGCVFTDALITGGEPWILYTGVDNGHASINLAAPTDTTLGVWMKATDNPIISGTPAGYSADFRDPYFFRNGNDAYCFVGTSRNGVASTSLHKYNTASGMFDYTGQPFFTGSNTAQCGTFFEMPNVTPMGNGQWLFTATPLETAQGVRTIYYVGTIHDDGTFHTTQAEPKTIELPGLAKAGYGLLSPTILQKDGKTIVIGIVPDKLSSNANYQAGWAHTFSFPREWTIDAQGELLQRPYEGLQNLRSSTSVSIAPMTLNGDLSLNPVSGQEVEVEVVFTVADKPFGIKILENENGACRIYYNPTTAAFTVDCSSVGRKSNDGGVFSGVYTSQLPAAVAAGEQMKIHVYFDHSVLDVFINDRWASSIRIFPTSSSAIGVSLFAEGDTQVQSASAWTMIPAESDLQDALPSIVTANASNKFIRDGRILIRQGNRTFTLTGTEIQ